MATETVEVIEVKKEGPISKFGRESSNWIKNNWQELLLGTIIFGLLEGTNTTNIWDGDPFRAAMRGKDGNEFFDKPVIDFWPNHDFTLIPKFNPWWEESN